jgi:plastocyanin
MMLTIACGAYPTSPSPDDTGTPGPSGATITINANAVATPLNVTISVGQSVTFVNNDDRLHDMASDPHPGHNECPPMNAAGNLQPGQTKRTNALTAAGSCRYHDHLDAENTSLRGTITVR